MKRIVMVAAVASLMFGCQSPRPISEEGEIEDAQPITAATVAEEPKPVAEVAEPVKEEPKIMEKETTMILMKTTMGDIKIELDKEKAPKTVENFLGYVESGHYNGTIFHRVINGFMIQGGGFDEDMNQKPAPKMVENEANNGLKNKVGSIAMARTSAPHSASAQFFINVGDNAFLDYPGQDGWGYCVFGEVVEGMDVVDEIKGVATSNAGPHQNVPAKPITITEVSISEE